MRLDGSAHWSNTNLSVRDLLLKFGPVWEIIVAQCLSIISRKQIASWINFVYINTKLPSYLNWLPCGVLKKERVGSYLLKTPWSLSCFALLLWLLCAPFMFCWIIGEHQMMFASDKFIKNSACFCNFWEVSGNKDLQLVCVILCSWIYFENSVSQLVLLSKVGYWFCL